MKRTAPKRVRVSRIALVGLPGAGKTTAGALLARELGWDFIDSDAEVVREVGLDIPAIFHARGEAAFRELENRTVKRALERDHQVIATGGGWAARPGTLASLPPGAVSAWLVVAPAEAAERLKGDDATRPLLQGADVAGRIARLEAERSVSYAEADVVVETSGRTPEAVAAEIAARLHSEYGIDGRSY